MNEKNTKKLYTDFPELYRGRNKIIQESLMPFGFACGDGWFDLIYKLSQDITAIDKETEAMQVKEKFGGLRFYINGAPKEVHDLIHKAEDKSYHICEMCGKKGKLREDLGWVLTLCNKHYKEIKKEVKSNGNRQ